MFKVSMFDIINPTFRNNIEVVWQCPQLSAQASFTAHKLRKAIKEAQQKAGKIQKDILKKYAQVNERGEPVFDPKTGACSFKEENGAELFSKEFEDVAKEAMFEIQAKKLNFNDLMNVSGLQPQFWEAVEQVIENVPQD